MRIDDWFAANVYHAKLSRLELADSGVVLQTDQVAGLVQAMASFEASYASSQGAVFDPTDPTRTAITDAAVIAAVNTTWQPQAV